MRNLLRATALRALIFCGALLLSAVFARAEEEIDLEAPKPAPPAEAKPEDGKPAGGLKSLLAEKAAENRPQPAAAAGKATDPDAFDEETKAKLAAGEMVEGYGYTRDAVGSDTVALATSLAGKMQQVWKRSNGVKEPHLVLVIDSSSSMNPLIEKFDEGVEALFKAGPENLHVSVVALRAKSTVLATAAKDAKEVRQAIRKCAQLSKDEQTRAKLKMNPAQRLQMRAWDDPVFLTGDDCVKNWCEAVRFCVKEFGNGYPISAVLVMTLDNCDTEDDIEGLAMELQKLRVTFMAAAPETLLTTSDPTAEYERVKFYEACKAELKIDYGENFLFHRRESAMNEISWVPGLNGPHENVGNNTGWGYYGLNRVAYATGGTYWIMHGPSDPKCPCTIHAPQDRLTRGGAAGPAKPPPLPWIQQNQAPVFKEIKPYTFDDMNQQKYAPCLLSRDRVLALYQASPWYQYLFSLNRIDQYLANALQRQAVKGQPWWASNSKAWYGAWLVTKWDEGPAAGGKAPADPAVGSLEDQLDALKIYAADRHPPIPWGSTWNHAGSGYAAFYTIDGVKKVQTFLESELKALDQRIEQARAGMPKGEPSKYEHRAKAEIEFFLMCLENNRFYVQQYLYYIPEMLKDPGALALLDPNAKEEDARKKAAEANAEMRKQKQAGAGIPHLEVWMPRLLKQRCEEFTPIMGKRPVIYGGGMGEIALNRFKKGFKDFDTEVGLSTWTNFFELGWQRQYHWRKITPTWSGPGGPVTVRVPQPPTYVPPGGPSGPEY
ncbi:MAG: VWA domain-containing protein [Planctomycetes bacterium]|nr:VWA domain-containing protein [Planctomycetota bacterium]